MSVTIILGAQWGDEGKGKIVDLLSAKADVVARYQGGPNAGHTVVIDEEEIVLHQIPSGMLHPHTRCIIGNGVVIDPVILMEEVDFLKSKGFRVDGRLFISHRAHLIMPYHKLLDTTREAAEGAAKIGTTGRGIGPAYVDKYDRCGIRIVDLLDRTTLADKLLKNLESKNKVLQRIYDRDTMDTEKIIQDYLEFDRRIDAYVKDTTVLINRAIDTGEEVLIEGAQGTMLDIDFGTYPYVTSSNPIAGGACTGLGIGPTRINTVLGVVKAYTTRVGMGPLPTEFGQEFGDRIRELGGEYGATTGRPRRCGWFDAVVVRLAAMVNGLTHLAITKLDVLDTLEEIKICTGYRYQGRLLDHYPAELWVQEQLEPVYESHPGWQTSTQSARTFAELPQQAQDYVRRLSELTHTPVSIVSVGSKRSQTIFME
ncbi:MAG TPA: adenylosuccinate synthase [bacterium]|nr:adenylosuccinate synthase [bacterium]HQG45292.1 adenylosuccinate synthase [bacterium]HQI50050.1 adenylosuccinate synthase [bacterium]HQJ62994.1 adenylosuccinate synthase [bacterium]